MRPIDPPGLELRHLAAAALLVGLAAVPVASATYHGSSNPFPTCDASSFADPGNAAFGDGRGEAGVEVVLDSPLQPFDPAVLVVDAGTCVKFQNDGPPHSVRVIADSQGHTFHTIDGDLDTGESVNAAFTDPGVYEVNCGKHPLAMHQVIHVV